MRSKKWFITTMIIYLVILAGFAAIMFICDPLLVFRDGSDRFSTLRYNQTYSAPGVARHSKYDMVVTGSCMVGQFNTDEVNGSFDADAIKLTFNGGTEKNFKKILDICYETNPSINKVLLSLDAFGAIKSDEETGYPLPEYLYDLTPESYSTYLLNLDIFYHYATYDIVGSLRGKKEGPTEILPDHSDGEYGVSMVLSTRDGDQLDKLPKIDTSEYSNNTLLNLQNNLIPIIESHPETEFIMFLPPYSILYWEKQLYYGTFEPMMESVRTVISNCIKYDNVKIYSCMWDKNIISDLDNYRDILHFSADVASNILNKISEDKNRLLPESYSSEIDDFISYVNSFDFKSYVKSVQQ